jgi:hypothetical protein
VSEFGESNFAHLIAMTSTYGTFEHADHAQPRVEHGHCTDDVARVLLAASREPRPSKPVADLASTSMRFLQLAQLPDGSSRNRRSSTGEWFGPATTGDCWGRSLWAFGTAAARSDDDAVRSDAVEAFNCGAQARSTWPRSTAHAVLGAAEILQVDPSNVAAIELMVEALPMLRRPILDEFWVWPEPRLSYANAVLPDAMMAVGAEFGDERLINSGLRQLGWLLALETRDGNLSPTPVGGRGPEGVVGLFDQQPIEAAAMADACVRAFELTNDAVWSSGLEMAVDWFLGFNDLGYFMSDPSTGGGYDGLTAIGPNLNQGAESTIALVTTLQHARQWSLM